MSFLSALGGGVGNHPTLERKGVTMTTQVDTDTKISRLLSQLDNPNLTQGDMDRIQRKINMLREEQGKSE